MSDTILDSPEAAEEVRALRENPSVKIRKLRRHLEYRFKGETCLVLGSSPDIELPSRRLFAKCLCVNSSGFLAWRRKGIIPDLTVLNGYTTLAKTPVALANLERLQGLQTKDLLFVSSGDTIQHATSQLSQIGYRFSQKNEINPIERAFIISEVCGTELGLGKRDQRISSGMFTAVLALWAGADKIILSGFSLGEGHYFQSETPRYHIDADQKCLSHFSKSFPQVASTSRELTAKFGFGRP